MLCRTGFPSLLVFVLVSSAWAGGALGAPSSIGPGGVASVDLPSPGYRGGRLAAGVGWSKIDEDHFLALDLGTVLDFGAFRLALQAPLNLRTLDNDPQDEGVVRREDWDEVSDWFRIVRFVDVGDPDRGPLYLRYGELIGASLGHGTIVDSYYNTIDPDHYQGGLKLRLDLGPAGGEVVFDNLADPEMLGVRGFVRPLRLAGVEGVLARKMAAGVSLVGDIRAPIRLETDAEGTPKLADTRVPRAEREATFFLGFDLELPVVDTPEFLIVPYTDVNVHIGSGTGWHLGVRQVWTPTEVFQLILRIEYRLLGPGYLPSYVNAIYEVERYQFLGGLTKLAYSRSAAADDLRSGALAELGMVLFRSLLIKGRYQGSARPDDDELWLQAALPYLAGLRISATYLKRTADGFEDMFDPAGALFVAEARYRFLGPLAFQALFSREWRVRDEGSDRGRYDTIDNWGAGLVVEVEF